MHWSVWVLRRLASQNWVSQCLPILQLVGEGRWTKLAGTFTRESPSGRLPICEYRPVWSKTFGCGFGPGPPGSVTAIG